MPDLLVVFTKRWKFILGLTILALIVAFIFTLISPKKYLATATALPANSMTADKARLFNDNIEALYSDFGSPDELDRMQGTAALDTIFIAASNELNLSAHYGMKPTGDAYYKAALKLKDNSRISPSGYGELKIKVWDKDRNMAAAMANRLLQNLQELHRRLQNETNITLLQKVSEDYRLRQDQFRKLSDTLGKASGADAEMLQAKKTALLAQLQQYEKMMDQYQLAVNANPQALLTVEKARAPLWPDKPKTLPTVLLCGFAAFVFAFLVAVFIESRKTPK